jgi:hypothetical protein
MQFWNPGQVYDPFSSHQEGLSNWLSRGSNANAIQRSEHFIREFQCCSRKVLPEMLLKPNMKSCAMNWSFSRAHISKLARKAADSAPLTSS